ncbi:hypothetical protein ACP70R_027100 [Stipagrostis hirtigluma subsp. patula]
MLREAAEVAGASGAKIRKRRAVSSSGASSDAVRKLRVRKRGVRLIGRRGVCTGTGTGTGASPCSGISRRRRMSESSPWNRHCRLADVETRSTSSAASARKLGSAFWQQKKGFEDDEEETEAGWDAAVARRSSDHHRRSASLEFSKMSRRKSNKGLEADGEKNWHNGHAHGHWFPDVLSNGGKMEVHALAQGLASPCPVDRAAQLQDLCNSLTASKELVRVLASVLGPGGLNPTAVSLLAALRSELDAARARARQLARQQRRHGDEEETAEQLRRQLLEEVRAWKSRQREKAAAAARVVASELDGERRSRRRAERVSKKLGEALAEAESSLRAATRELERERRSRQRLEKVCDELARGGGGAEAEAEAEELRRVAESAAREELEREREMLQVADELREERVRMKLAEARLQFEEKNAVVDRLRQELEAFLHTTNNQDQQFPAGDKHRVANDDDHQLQLALASEFGVHGIDRVAVHRNREGGNGNDSVHDDEGSEDDDSEGSDIELNMDGNSKDYSWSYTTASKETTTKNAASVHGSLSERVTDSGAGDFDRRSERAREALEQDWDDGCSDDRTTTKDLDEDAERYEAIKNLREQMLAGNGFVFMSQGGADDERERHSQGLICQIEQGRLW